MLYRPYCKPFPPILKEFFCFFCNFFCEGPQPPKRGAQKSQEKFRRVGNFTQNEAHGLAQGGEINPCAQAEGGQVEQPHPTIPPLQGEDEEGAGHPQPEQQVQAGFQPAPAQPPPQEAEQVVGCPRRRAQPCRLEEEDGLLQAFRVHQPNSRAKKPTCSPPPSS